MRERDDVRDVAARESDQTGHEEVGRGVGEEKVADRAEDEASCDGVDAERRFAPAARRGCCECEAWNRLDARGCPLNGAGLVAGPGVRQDLGQVAGGNKGSDPEDPASVRRLGRRKKALRGVFTQQRHAAATTSAKVAAGPWQGALLARRNERRSAQAAAQVRR